MPKRHICIYAYALLRAADAIRDIREYTGIRTDLIDQRIVLHVVVTI
ncbi:MAG: hypothetical protein ACXQTY_00610 [Candidatus Methanogasteraceae archaeon]